uniref:Uncharacterized protein n=1 Tax=Ditylenchus dipsaci TaxID=166011 RepID=A0A915ECQ1_9BILA
MLSLPVFLFFIVAIVNCQDACNRRCQAYLVQLDKMLSEAKGTMAELEMHDYLSFEKLCAQYEAFYICIHECPTYDPKLFIETERMWKEVHQECMPGTNPTPSPISEEDEDEMVTQPGTNQYSLAEELMED